MTTIDIAGINALLEGTTIAPIIVPATPKAARKPKAAKKVATNGKPVNVATKNGGMMDSTPGSITRGQLSKLIALCDSIGEPLESAEIEVIKGWSMAATSDYRYEILNPAA